MRLLFIIYLISIINISTAKGETSPQKVKGICRLTKEDGYCNLQWASDSKRFIATNFREGTIVIFKLNANNTSAEKRGIISTEERKFLWSPDGKKIAYTIFKEAYGDSGLCIILTEVNNEGEITKEDTIPLRRHWIQEFIWSPDAKKIAFIDEEGINIMDLTTKKTQLIIKIDCHILTWLPSEIISYIPIENRDIYGHLTIFNLNTKEKTILLPDILIYDAIWCFPKQGPSKVYVRLPLDAMQGDLWMDEDGSNIHVDPGPEVFEDWAPDGSGFLYMDQYFAEQQNIELAKSDFGIIEFISPTPTKTLLVNTPDIWEEGPRWSPDKSKIIYLADEGKIEGRIYLLSLKR